MSTEVLEQTDRLVLKRTYDCTLDAMWAAWTEPEQIAKWFGCAQTSNVEATLDLRRGGEFRIEMKGEGESSHTAAGHYTEVTPKTRLAYTWEWQGDEEMQFGETIVELDFAEVGDRVELTLTHRGFPSAELTALHHEGWTASFENLAAVVEAA